MFNAGSQGSQTLFMGGYSSVASDAGAAKKPRQEESQPCLPVTIRTIELALAQRDGGDAELHIHGVEPGMLVLVGLVESVAHQAASIDFMLNDTTGRIKARYYVTEGEPALTGVEVGRYVSLAAAVRTTPAVHLTVTCLRPIASADEISYHMIECGHAALKLQQQSKVGDILQTTPVKKRADEDEALSSIKAAPAAPTMTDINMAPAASVVAAAPSAAKVPLQGAALRAAVLELLQQDGVSAEGVSFARFRERFSATPEGEVRSTIQGLVSDGDAYNTIDEDHFAAI